MRHHFVLVTNMQSNASTILNNLEFQLEEKLRKLQTNNIIAIIKLCILVMYLPCVTEKLFLHVPYANNALEVTMLPSKNYYFLKRKYTLYQFQLHNTDKSHRIFIHPTVTTVL